MLSGMLLTDQGGASDHKPRNSAYLLNIRGLGFFVSPEHMHCLALCMFRRNLHFRESISIPPNRWRYLGVTWVRVHAADNIPEIPLPCCQIPALHWPPPSCLDPETYFRAQLNTACGIHEDTMHLSFKKFNRRDCYTVTHLRTVDTQLSPTSVSVSLELVGRGPLSLLLPAHSFKSQARKGVIIFIFLKEHFVLSENQSLMHDVIADGYLYALASQAAFAGCTSSHR